MWEECVGRPQQVDDVIRGRAHLIGRRIVVAVRSPDVAQIVPRQHEHHAPVDGGREGERVRVPDAFAWHRHVHAFGGSEQGIGTGVVEAPHAVYPGSGRVHDHERPYRRSLARQAVPHGRAAHPAVRFEERRGFCVVRDQRARLRGAAHGRNHEAGVVGLRVVVQGRALQLFIPQPRLQTLGRLASQPAVPFHIVERREQIVQPHSRAELPGRYPRAAVDREEEGQGVHQMRRDAEQHATLVAGLEYQAKLALLEIADPAVDEPG